MVPGYRFWGGPIALQCFVHISDKKTPAIKWSSTILTVTHMWARVISSNPKTLSQVLGAFGLPCFFFSQTATGHNWVPKMWPDTLDAKMEMKIK